MMAAHGIPVSAQEMIIRRRKDRFIVEIVPNVPPETRRRPPVAAATGLADICKYRRRCIYGRLYFIYLKIAAAAATAVAAAATAAAAAVAAAAAAAVAAAAAAPCGSGHHAAAAPRGSSTMRQHSYV